MLMFKSTHEELIEDIRQNHALVAQKQQQTIDELTQTVSDLTAALGEKIEESSSFQKKFGDLSTDHDALVIKHHELNQMKETNVVAELEEALNTTKNQVAGLEEVNASLASKNEMLIDRIAALEARLAKAEVKKPTKKTSSKAKVKAPSDLLG